MFVNNHQRVALKLCLCFLAFPEAKGFTGQKDAKS